MSEVIKSRLSGMIGKEITVFLKSGLKFFGKLTNLDDKYIEVLDYKTSSYKIIILDDISDLNVPAGNGGDEDGKL